MTDTETNREAETGIDATTGADAGAETADADTEPETADAEPDRDATPVPIADPNSALTPSGGSNPSSRTGDWRTDRKSGPSKRSSRPTVAPTTQSRRPTERPRYTPPSRRSDSRTATP